MSQRQTGHRLRHSGVPELYFLYSSVNWAYCSAFYFHIRSFNGWMHVTEGCSCSELSHTDHNPSLCTPVACQSSDFRHFGFGIIMYVCTLSVILLEGCVVTLHNQTWYFPPEGMYIPQSTSSSGIKYPCVNSDCDLLLNEFTENVQKIPLS